MNKTNKPEVKNRLQYWTVKVAAVVVLVLIGYKIPEMWPPICVIIWAAYALSLIVSSILLAKAKEPKSDNTFRFKSFTSFIGNLATAALISAPIVVGHWYRMTYFRKH